MPFDNRPIGVFDSGIGGLSVARLIMQQLPKEEIIYIGDTANLPYGNKSVPELIDFARRIVDFLMRYDVKAIVAACNTSSSVSISILRDSYAVPIIGVVKPGVRAAVRISRNRRIGVLATEATAKSSAYRREILALEGNAMVWEVPCPLLVPMVEAGETEGPVVREVLGSYLESLMKNQVDTIILGCTHYPYLRPIIEELIGHQVSIVDPAAETARVLNKTLADLDAYGDRHAGDISFFATGSSDSFYKVGSRFFGRKLERVQTVKV